ncbi:MAG: epoxyqueuosine reductase QueH [Patescibacteria group bacterium]
MAQNRPRLLLHICCATCAAYVLEQMRHDYDVTALYYNLNIYPREEYQRRFSESQEYCAKHGISFIEIPPDGENWLAMTRGHEQDPERGGRCTICYRMRLQKTAEYAKAREFDLFGTDLSISPHKDARRLNQIGKELEKEYSVMFLEADFKKQDGFKKAMALSRKEGFYRQDYCGCKYSIRKNIQFPITNIQ